MSGRSEAPVIRADRAAADDLRQRFQAVARLSKQSVEPAEFFQSLLGLLAKDLAAGWSVAWIRSGEQWHRVTQPAQRSAAVEQEIAGDGFSAVAEALAEDSSGCHQRVTAQGTLLTLPVRGELLVVLQLALRQLDRTTASPPPVEIAQQLLEAYGQLSEDYDRNRSLQRLRIALAHQQRWTRLSDAVHASLDLDRTGYEIVAAIVAATGCTRASVLVRHRKGFRVLAVSGVATLDARAPILRALQRLATAVAHSGEPLVHAADAQPRAPQLSQPLDSYLDLAHCPGLLVLPLRIAERPAEEPWADIGRGRDAGDDFPIDADCCGILVLESSDPASLPLLLQQTQAIANSCAIALRNARDHSMLPLRRTATALHRLGAGGWTGRQRGLGVAALAVTCVAILTFVPAPLKIHAPGTLQPARIHNAFAPRDGYVKDVLVEHDQPVNQGSLLLTLHSPDLELELRRTEGAIQSTQMELRAAEAARRRGGQSSESPRDEAAGFAAGESRLLAVLDSYHQQLAMLRDEQAALAIHSPLEGHVLSWQVRQTLLGRPVQRGQRLLQVAASDSEWTLALEVPDRDAGHLLYAQTHLRPDLAVEYFLATEAQQRHEGRVTQVARITEMSDQGQPVVEVTVAIEQERLRLPRSGAQVRAEIDCGPYPLGYVWFHHLWDTLWSLLQF